MKLSYHIVTLQQISSSTHNKISQNSFQENPKMLHNMIDVHDDEADETLSLCDLEIYSDAATSQEFSYRENEISSSSASSSSWSSSDQDLFEFFSEDWNTNGTISSFHSNTQRDDILFCGKLIPSRKPNSPIRIKSGGNQAKPKKSRGLFRWNSDMSFYKSSSKSNVAASCATTAPRSKSAPVPGKYGGKNDTLMPKRVVSIFQSPTKSRWYLFLFGMSGGLPTKMELSDIRSRQLRRNPSTMFRVGGGDEAELGGSGRMRLVRALGCGAGIEASTVETASVGCFGGI